MNAEIKLIVKYFLVWRILLFAVAILVIYFLPQFGGRFPYADRVLEITKLPSWIWGWGNFDGVHYLRIAQDGYRAEYSQAFFPLFPILIRIFAFFLPKVPNLNTMLYVDPAYFYSGFILSNLFLVLSLVMFYKLLVIDFSKDVAKKSLILLLAFPVSFYFGAIYSESLFLLLAVGAMLCLRRERFIMAGILISFS